ncbi:phosphatidylserine decarboxylase family protein [Coprobacter tertius]|uniref:Phosphatidylserine decarboxylase proenzyme n=1 Tax=Coprobacter tertius TaxID=2944915 RepID=A0ABT1MEJ6_9BACT|nr:phosphatidylserine decarboxylase family protein [Coprobacter tertius]MCP9611038.1 phosphatidylserine decarboxylase family protein [Coprobacter tertius]
MKIHQEGRNILLILILLLAVINGLIYVFFYNHYFSVGLLTVSVVFYLLVLNFFRSPKRHFKGDTHNVVVAPADGTIVAVEEVIENEYFHEKRIQISIFMTIFNVHANWFPVNGKVLHVSHQPGRFMAAYLPKSSTENERSTIIIKAENGQEILTRQIAGAMARRIVTYAEPGDECHIDEHMGFIKFGSRVDVFLPLDAEIMVSLDDKTTGNLTQIARLK